LRLRRRSGGLGLIDSFAKRGRGLGRGFRTRSLHHQLAMTGLGRRSLLLGSLDQLLAGVIRPNADIRDIETQELAHL
jgi:hypothetical protein